MLTNPFHVIVAAFFVLAVVLAVVLARMALANKRY